MGASAYPQCSVFLAAECSHCRGGSGAVATWHLPRGPGVLVFLIAGAGAWARMAEPPVNCDGHRPLRGYRMSSVYLLSVHSVAARRHGAGFLWSSFLLDKATQVTQLTKVRKYSPSLMSILFLESTFQDPCPTLNGTRRATMPQVQTRRSEPIHPSSQARSPAPLNLLES